jgi:hypothetical protein
MDFDEMSRELFRRILAVCALVLSVLAVLSSTTRDLPSVVLLAGAAWFWAKRAEY